MNHGGNLINWNDSEILECNKLDKHEKNGNKEVNIYYISAVPAGLPPDIWFPPSANHPKLKFDGSLNTCTNWHVLGAEYELQHGTS